MSLFRVLTLGDIVGPAAVEYVRRKAPPFCTAESINAVVANGENACVGNGLDGPTARNLLGSGIDVLTSGNHIWHKKDIREYLDSTDRVIRPANYRATNPGVGYTKITCDGMRLLVMNVMGVVYMDPLDNPFYCIERIINHEKGNYDLSILDIHAEATSEKYALARYFDGRVNIIFGTHTHVQTADEQVLPKGSGFICDLGMCGPKNSILGVRSECIIEKLTTNMPVKFELAEGEIEARGAIFTVDTDSGAVVSVERILI